MLENTTTDLEDRLEDLNDKLEALSVRESQPANNNTAENERLRDELASVKECLTLCAKVSEHADQVRTNVFEDVSAAQDARQVIVSTLGDLISAKRVTADTGAEQWLGQMSDATVQELAKSRGVSLGSDYRTAKGTQEKNEGIARFEDQYGFGHKLS